MKLYNTLTKKKEEFVPLQEGKVTLSPMIVVSPMITPLPWSMNSPFPIVAPG